MFSDTAAQHQHPNAPRQHQRQPRQPSPTPICPPVITQSTSQAITAGNSISCNSGPPGFFQSDNSYWRAFDMATFTNSQQYNVTSVSFGIEMATRWHRHDSTHYCPPLHGNSWSIPPGDLDPDCQHYCRRRGPDVNGLDCAFGGNRAGWNDRADHGSLHAGRNSCWKRVLYRVECGRGDGSGLYQRGELLDSGPDPAFAQRLPEHAPRV